MIPKKIHYCWFGGKPLPPMAKKCIESWKKYFPDYQIIEWNESNFDINFNKFAKEAYEHGKFAFFTDVARLYIIYKHGGIYFDIDVEIIKKYDDIVNNKSFFGLESIGHVNTGLGFGAEKGNSLIKKMLDDYECRRFEISDGTLNEQACPILNSVILKENGFKLDGNYEIIDGNSVYPIDYFNPKGGYGGNLIFTDNTHSVHHYDGSWLSEEERKRSYVLNKFESKFGIKYGKAFYHIICFPYIILSSIKEIGLKKTIKKILFKCN